MSNDERSTISPEMANTICTMEKEMDKLLGEFEQINEQLNSQIDSILDDADEEQARDDLIRGTYKKRKGDNWRVISTLKKILTIHCAILYGLFL